MIIYPAIGVTHPKSPLELTLTHETEKKPHINRQHIHNKQLEIVYIKRRLGLNAMLDGLTSIEINHCFSVCLVPT